MCSPPLDDLLRLSYGKYFIEKRIDAEIIQRMRSKTLDSLLAAFEGRILPLPKKNCILFGFDIPGSGSNRCIKCA
jgi:hypothetical protein